MKKKMVLTGIGSEQEFSDNGKSHYFLVFNHGELRVPTSEDVMQTIVQFMYGQEPSHVEQTEEQEDEPEEEQAEEDTELPYASTFGVGRNGQGLVTDEDGVSQV